jgi:flavin reductase (DIM6/NTAB) family NADH-FMN oxidoreductase RutF
LVTGSFSLIVKPFAIKLCLSMKQSLRITTAFFPTPCVLVVSGDMSNANIITIAWSGVVNSDPPMVGVSLRAQTHSFALMKKHNEFTVNIPHEGMLRQVDICGVVTGADVDKFAYAHLTKVASNKVSTPIIGEAIISLECKLKQRLELGSHYLFIGEVVEIHVDETILDKEGKITLEKIKPFVYCPVVHEYRAMGKKLGTYGYSKGKI